MDIIAVTIIIGCFFLIFYGKDGTVSATLTLIAGYYFGKRTSGITRQENINQKDE